MSRRPGSVVLALCGLAALASCDSSNNTMKRAANFDPAANIAMTEAIDIALAEIGGGFAIEAELEMEEDEEFAYEVEVYNGGQLWEVEIRPSDGTIIEVELEDEDDDDDD